VKRDEQFVQPGDVLMSMANSYELVGKVAMVRQVRTPTAFGAFLSAVRPTAAVNGKFLFHLLRTERVQRAIREGSSQTTNIANIAVGRLVAIPMPVPPLNEQKRIAEKLDMILARVDTCRDRLDRIPIILKGFRQSILAAATSGKLTEEWRGGEELAGWRNASLAELCHSVSDGDHQAPPQSATGIPFITISAINDGRLRLEKATRFVPLSYYETQKTSRRPKRGDVLFSVTGSIGIPALVDTDEDFTFQRHIAILKPDHSQVSSSYLMSVLGSENIRQQAIAVATGTAQVTIPLNGLRSFVISLPPPSEQAEIVRRVESLFAYADRLESRYAAARAQVEKLTPATLAKAFRGELVPQDPNDEPAAELLRRLAGESAARSRTRRVPKRRNSERDASVALNSLAQTKKDMMKKQSLVKLEDIPHNHLANILNTTKKQDAKALWTVSGLSIDDFYVQLNREIGAGLLRVCSDNESRLELVVAKAPRGKNAH
jgi:type I restriction enzyme S subunit